MIARDNTTFSVAAVSMSWLIQPWTAIQQQSLPTGRQAPARHTRYVEMRLSWGRKIGHLAVTSTMVSSHNRFATCGSLWLCAKNSSMSRQVSLRFTTSSCVTCSIHPQVSCNHAGTSKMDSLSRTWWWSNALAKKTFSQFCMKVCEIDIKAATSWTQTHLVRTVSLPCTWSQKLKTKMTASYIRSTVKFPSLTWQVASD